MLKILVVDDEIKILQVIEEKLKSAGHNVHTTTSGEFAIQKIKEEEFDIIFTDLVMKPVDGMKILEEAKKNSPQTRVIIITAYGSINSAVEAMKKGADNYIQKPFSLDEIILITEKIEKERKVFLEREHFEEKIKELKAEKIIGESKKIKALTALIEKLSKRDTPVFIYGETGTGKELIARNIHYRSARAKGPFIAINCAALLENLLESELFGYEKGAFTGAVKRKLGLFQVADGGTLFLDEIGDMPIFLQAKLLRAIEEKRIMPLGSTISVPVNTRIISASNKNLSLLVKEKKFREDLYFRIAVFTVEVPPLREHPEDIPLLVDFILKNKFSFKGGISENAINALKKYHWPGNVRELENVLERAIILLEKGGGRIEPQHLNLPFLSEREPEKTYSPLSLNIEEMEKKLIEQALEKTGWNISKSAKELGITRRMLYVRMKKYGIKE